MYLLETWLLFWLLKSKKTLECSECAGTCWSSRKFWSPAPGCSSRCAVGWSSCGSPDDHHNHRVTSPVYALAPFPRCTHSTHTPTCWPRLLRCPGCSVCSTWMRMYSWSVMSIIPPAKGPPTCNFSRALSRKSVRFMAAWQVASREQRHRGSKKPAETESIFFFLAVNVRTSRVCDAALKDTEGVCGGDCQHPPGVVSVWIHAEEELEAE